MTGQKTRRGGNTHLGSAKPDDPIYKEGWQVHLPKLGQRSSEPSNTLSPESALATLEKNFTEALAQYDSDPQQQTWQALRDQVSRLTQMRLAAGKPISDLLPRMQQAMAQKPQKQPLQPLQ